MFVLKGVVTSLAKHASEVRFSSTSLRLYVRALQRAKVMDANYQVSETLPDNFPAQYHQWARYHYEGEVEEAMNADGQDDENKPTFKDLTMALFEDTLIEANFVVTICSNAADETLRKFTQPSIVIIDEAGVAKELETLMAIYHNLDSVVRIIFLGDHLQLPPTVLSHLRKLVATDRHSLPYNIFTPQLCMSLMARQIENGIRHKMFKKQYRMTAGIEELSSRMCYGGQLENADTTLLARRQRSRNAIEFIRENFGVTTTVPHLFLNVYKGICLRGRTKSRSNPPNVIIVMYVLESVLKHGCFHGADICIITPYREQATLIR